jgi:hypothetical protein
MWENERNFWQKKNESSYNTLCFRVEKINWKIKAKREKSVVSFHRWRFYFQTFLEFQLLLAPPLSLLALRWELQIEKCLKVNPFPKLTCYILALLVDVIQTWCLCVWHLYEGNWNLRNHGARATCKHMNLSWGEHHSLSQGFEMHDL